MRRSSGVKSKSAEKFHVANSGPHTFDGASCAGAEASLEFGRFQVLPRQRLLLADRVPVELGTRAFEVLLALLDADGALVTKEQLLARAWPGIVVTEQNLKVQIFALRRAFGDDRDFIRTEYGRGYRFTAAIRSNAAQSGLQGPVRPRSWSTRVPFPEAHSRRPSYGWSIEDRFGRDFDPRRDPGAQSRRG
jgi:DNA-binding winged helix-turn-helix (wHTH) protein